MQPSPARSPSPLAWILLRLLSFYQRTLSPDHGLFQAFFPYGACRYFPSCSEYMTQSILRFGALGGVLRGIARILRCNPWSRGGVDPIF